jgi:hypothetical protein
MMFITNYLVAKMKKKLLYLKNSYFSAMVKYTIMAIRISDIYYPQTGSSPRNTG